MTTLYIHADHDCAVAFIDKNNRVRLFELERFNKIRHSLLTGVTAYQKHYEGTEEEKREFFKLIKNTSSPITKIKFHSHEGTKHVELDRALLEELFTDNIELTFDHHRYHAYAGYCNSGFDKAFILSIDGGGNSSENEMRDTSWTNIYHAEKGNIEHLVSNTQDNLGMSYGSLGWYMKEIQGPICDKLEWPFAGKIMGLCAYGNVREEWLNPLIEYFRSPHWEMWHPTEHWEESLKLQEGFGISLGKDCFEGQDSFDFAATAQKAFETVAMSLIEPYINEYDNFILTGGCALNVLFNQKLKKHLHSLGKNLYVPSNPNDCGLAAGMLAQDNPDKRINVYSGLDILDLDSLDDYVQKRNARKTSIAEVVDLIKDGKIIGMVSGESELGPRALGNRSIICDPSIANMKDILNEKVKYREWFRPFAPVCRLEDMHTYFDDVFESEFMSYAPYIKREYTDKLAAVCHVDNTARLQTVTHEQHPIFYEILSELEFRNEIPVILNTSFNIKGQPILTTIEDALYCLDNTKMDYVIIEGWLFDKKE